MQYVPLYSLLFIICPILSRLQDLLDDPRMTITSDNLSKQPPCPTIIQIVGRPSQGVLLLSKL